jgi:hypothetical protein
MPSVRYAMVLLVPMVTLAMDSSEGSSGDFKGSNQSTFDDFVWARIRFGQNPGKLQEAMFDGDPLSCCFLSLSASCSKEAAKNHQQIWYKVLNQRDQRTNGAVFEYH